MSDAFDAPGKDAKKGNASLEGVRRNDEPSIDGVFASIAGEGHRRDPVSTNARPTAAKQISRSLKAWRDQSSQGEGTQPDQSAAESGAHDERADDADSTGKTSLAAKLKRLIRRVPNDPGSGDRIMRAEDPAKKKEQALTDIKSKAASFANLQCVECADALKAILVKAGVKGSIIRITNKPPNKNGFVYCVSKSKNVSQSNFHVGVVVDGIVYDNHHAQGIARGAWLGDFAHMGNPAGGAAAFDVSESAF